MSKRRKSTSDNSEKRDTIKFCSFWGLTIAALLFVVTAILNLINIDSLGTVINVLDIIAKVALLIAVGIPAYGYVRGKSKTWKIIFWVALIIYALGVVFSVIRIG